MFSLKGSGYMKCPNCKKEMKIKRETGFIPDFSGTADYDLYYDYNIYRCPDCKIKYNEDRKNDKWEIPKKLLPTEKQKNPILFINNRLGEDFESLTKRQCWEIINQNFDKAKNTPKPSNYGYDYDDIDEVYGISEEFYY